MVFRALHGRHVLAAAAFVAAVLVLAVQLITSSPVVVSVGADGAETVRIGRYFTYGDVAVVAVAAALLGSSGTYLLLGASASAGPRDEAPGDETATRSKGATPESAAAATAADGAGTATADPHAADPEGDARREDWESVAERLTDSEETVYRLVLDAGGELPQREIVEDTDLSKATVSRTLDTLEHRDLLERERHGMGNLVTLQ
ncbi:helix-turn-helix transcriptional regulator [Halosimplex aquaticum]|uniref:Helix-turn-helix transcriptional regulator n=1 Tax=Halosimplex aquaticum TaxID=3026162 RepID=A0ABD5XYY8_9EURY|nr:helix-turn-helix domain-containing protein [Halosimplex aquaticum]